MSFLPITAVIMLFIVIAATLHWNHISHWLAEGVMDPESDYYDKIIAGKEAYLNSTFFLIRSFLYVIIWVYCARRLRQISLDGDLEGEIGEKSYWKGLRVSGWFIVLFAVTSSTAAWDWIMSIDPHWFSTLFGWYVFAGMFVSGITTIALITIYLKSKNYLQS